MNIIEKTYKWNGTPGERDSTKFIVIHHAAAKTCSADDVHRWHLDNGWCGIGYNFFVRKDGSIYRGRPESWIGAHTIGLNDQSVGICFEGNFDVETMPNAQLVAGSELVDFLKKKYGNPKVVKHKDYASTACPGKNFPFTEMVNDIIKPTAKPVVNTNNDEEMVEVKIPMIEKGDKGPAVKAMQRLLITNGYSCGRCGADGDFGADTDAAVRKFQKAKKIDVDGICGTNTWTYLILK